MLLPKLVQSNINLVLVKIVVTQSPMLEPIGADEIDIPSIRLTGGAARRCYYAFP